MAEQAPTPHQQDAATPATASSVSDAEEVVEDRIETLRTTPRDALAAV